MSTSTIHDLLDQQKRGFAEALVALCPFVLLDATKERVVVPEILIDKQLVLRIGRNPSVLGMPDLVIDAEGFRGTISIKGPRFWIDVPWYAVTRLWIGEPFLGPAVIWPEVVETTEEPKPGLRLIKGS